MDRENIAMILYTHMQSALNAVIGDNVALNEARVSTLKDGSYDEMVKIIEGWIKSDDDAQFIMALIGSETGRRFLELPPKMFIKRFDLRVGGGKSPAEKTDHRGLHLIR